MLFRSVLVLGDRAEAMGDADTPISLEGTGRRLDRDGTTSPSPQRHGQSPTGSVGTNRSLPLHSQTPFTACQKSVDFLIFSEMWSCVYICRDLADSPAGVESPSRIDHRSDPAPMKKGGDTSLWASELAQSPEDFPRRICRRRARGQRIKPVSPDGMTFRTAQPALAAARG